jgi:putative ABC transport system substrate-binding protein
MRESCTYGSARGALSNERPYRYRRRDFITILGSAAAWPIAARAQQAERTRRVGVLMGFSENDPDGRTDLPAFARVLAELGWTDGRNLRMDVRWSGADPDRIRMFAKELVELQPNVIVAHSTPVAAQLRRATQAVPIVFVSVSDPIGDGFVAGLSHPGGNMTGFINYEGSIAGKWLELLKEIAPGVKRAAAMFNPDTAPGGGSYFLSPFKAAARSLDVELIEARVHSEAEIEMVINSLGHEPGGAFVQMSDGYLHAHVKLMLSLAERNKVPAVYNGSSVVRQGGLISYQADRRELFPRAASYVDRILRGAKPADLPVQLPTKFEMAVNLKTAKALGLTVPPTLLTRADEVIE